MLKHTHKIHMHTNTQELEGRPSEEESSSSEDDSEVWKEVRRRRRKGERREHPAMKSTLYHRSEPGCRTVE